MLINQANENDYIGFKSVVDWCITVAEMIDCLSAGGHQVQDCATEQCLPRHLPRTTAQNVPCVRPGHPQTHPGDHSHTV